MKPGALPTLFFAGAFAAAFAWMPPAAGAAETEKVYWLLSQNSGKTWCAYSNGDDYKRAVAVQQPAETARVAIFAGEVMELEYQITPASGEWVVMDKYIYTGAKPVLQRTSLLLLEGLEVVQETTIGGATAAPLRVVSIKTLDGEKATRAPRANPDVPVRATWKDFTFLAVARKLESAAAPEICERVN